MVSFDRYLIKMIAGVMVIQMMKMLSNFSNRSYTVEIKSRCPIRSSCGL